MSLLVLGLSHHRAPIEVLERAALDEQRRRRLADLASASADVAESVVVSTCNRTEVYAEVRAFHGAVADLTDAIVASTGVTREELKDHLDLQYGEAAVAHVFNVAAGLDSMAVGESQILGQLRDALALSQREGHVGPTLNALVQRALRTGKRVHTDTDIDAVSRSLVSAGLDLAERHVGALADQHVLVVGAGAMSALAATTATRRGAARLTVLNRTRSRADALAERLGGEGVGTEALPAALAAADVVVSCTGSAGLVVQLAHVADAQVARGGRPQAFVDLALPHDVAEEVAELTGVLRVGLADLGAAVDGIATSPEVARARRIVADEVARHAGERAATAAAPTVRALREAAHHVMERELERLGQRTTGMSAHDREEVRLAVHRVVDKLLHGPTIRAKEMAVDGRLTEYEEAIRQLFDLHADGGLR